jgi:alpha-D-xyloside xylohydrolase
LAAAAAAAVLTASVPAAVAAQDTLVARTTSLEVRLAGTTGELALLVLDSAGAVVHRASAPGVSAGGEPQRGFRALDERRARNDRLEVGFEVLGPRAIAVTWAPLAGGRPEAGGDARPGGDTRPGGDAAGGGHPPDPGRLFELRLLSDDETAYYGTGERFNALDQRGYTLPLVTDDRYGNKCVGSHKPVPFFMSSRGFGVWVDSFLPGSFDLSATERFVSRLTFPGDGLRVVFFGGPDLADVLEAYTALTGRPPVPPPWAFGLWKSRDVHHDRDSVLVDVERLREHGIPASVLVLDSPWETGYNDFEVNREQFRDPEAMFARIRELGFELCLWLTPFVNDSSVIDMRGVAPETSTFREAARAGHLVEDSTGAVALSRWWKGRGGLVDFTDPAAIAWWHEQLGKTRAYGARAFKVDDGEGNFVPDAVFADGSDARAMKNRYAILYDSVMQAYVDEELGGDGVLIVRSGYAGVQRFPFAWAGDNRGSFAWDDGLPSVLLAGLNAALSGISLWGSDIAGYAGTPSKEVFIRWTQLGAFSPFMQVHMTSNLGPWDFDAETLEIFRAFTALRTSLFPYLYDAVHEAARTGLPVMRPMALAFQDDPEAAHHVHQYLFGPDLLVAPVIQPGTHRSVYVPAGEWIDYWSGEARTGPGVIEVEAPLARMPLFVRAGAILPRLPEGVQTLVERHAVMAPGVVALDERRVLEVWPGADGAVVTWDGLSAELVREGGQVTLRVASEPARPVEIRLRGRRLPDLEAGGGTVRVEAEADRTILAFDALAGERTWRWRESGR